MTSEQYECVIADLTKQVNERDARVAELEQMVAVLMRHEARDDTIKVQRARIAELEMQVAFIKPVELAHLARIAELKAALKPFAGMAQYCDNMSDSENHCVFVGDLRAASAALGE